MNNVINKKNQIDVALDMIDKAQKELGHNFDINDFRKLLELKKVSSDTNIKEMQKIIRNIINNN